MTKINTRVSYEEKKNISLISIFLLLVIQMFFIWNADFELELKEENESKYNHGQYVCIYPSLYRKSHYCEHVFEIVNTIISRNSM